MMTWQEYKAKNPKHKRWRYNKYKREENKKEGEDVGITEVAGKLVKDVNDVMNPPKPVVKIDFNVEVGAVLVACDENRAKIDRVQDIITDRAVPEEALISLEEIHIALGNIKALTVKMLASYKEADAGIAVLEKEAAEVQTVKKKLAAIRATRAKEKTEAQ